MSKKDFSTLSFKFRKVASRLFSSNGMQDVLHNLKLFMNFIEQEPVIADFIGKQNQTQFDMDQIIKDRHYNSYFSLPDDSDDEVAFIYQLLKFGCDNFNDYYNFCHGYGRSYSDQIRNFNNHIVKTLYEAITTFLGEWSITMGYDENEKIKIIGPVGQFNYAKDKATINATQNNYHGAEELKSICHELIQLLEKSYLEEKEEAMEVVEAAQEEIDSPKKRKSIVKLAIEKITNVTQLVDKTSQLGTKCQEFIVKAGEWLQFSA